MLRCACRAHSPRRGTATNQEFLPFSALLSSGYRESNHPALYHCNLYTRCEGKQGVHNGSNDAESFWQATKIFDDPAANEVYISDGYGNRYMDNEEQSKATAYFGYRRDATRLLRQKRRYIKNEVKCFRSVRH